MPRKSRPEVNEATSQQIKKIARELMAESGTAGLSLRAIARKLGMTAPALYHYFASLDDLITALIVDAFTNHARYVRAARDAAAEAGLSRFEQVWAAVCAYRTWALEYSIDFQLIYGNPIPGYQAPSDVTTPAAQQLGQVFMEPVMAAVTAGEVTIPAPYCQIPPTVLSHYQQKYGMDESVAKVFHVLNQNWSILHGLVVLEVYNHLDPVVGDPTAFYEQTVRNHMLQTYQWSDVAE